MDTRCRTCRGDRMKVVSFGYICLRCGAQQGGQQEETELLGITQTTQLRRVGWLQSQQSTQEELDSIAHVPQPDLPRITLADAIVAAAWRMLHLQVDALIKVHGAPSLLATITDQLWVKHIASRADELSIVLRPLVFNEKEENSVIEPALYTLSGVSRYLVHPLENLAVLQVGLLFVRSPILSIGLSRWVLDQSIPSLSIPPAVTLSRHVTSYLLTPIPQSEAALSMKIDHYSYHLVSAFTLHPPPLLPLSPLSHLCSILRVPPQFAPIASRILALADSLRPEKPSLLSLEQHKRPARYIAAAFLIALKMYSEDSHQPGTRIDVSTKRWHYAPEQQPENLRSPLHHSDLSERWLCQERKAERLRGRPEAVLDRLPLRKKGSHIPDARSFAQHQRDYDSLVEWASKFGGEKQDDEDELDCENAFGWVMVARPSVGSITPCVNRTPFVHFIRGFARLDKLEYHEPWESTLNALEVVFAIEAHHIAQSVIEIEAILFAKMTRREMHF